MLYEACDDLKIYICYLMFCKAVNVHESFKIRAALNVTGTITIGQWQTTGSTGDK